MELKHKAIGSTLWSTLEGAGRELLYRFVYPVPGIRDCLLLGIVYPGSTIVHANFRILVNRDQAGLVPHWRTLAG